MRLLMLGDGTGTIPPQGRGAIQTIIWEYATGLRSRGHEVEIANVRASRLGYRLPGLLSGRRFDWVWTHHDPSVAWVRRYFRGHHVHLSHRPVTDPRGLDHGDLRRLRRAAAAPFHFCLTREMMLANRIVNPNCDVAMLPNGVDVGAFRWSERGRGAICLGAISERKRQLDVLRSGVTCDFVGPLDEQTPASEQVAGSDLYRGAWTGETIRERLTEYATLVLFSRAEAQPLVVGEAFAAGLSVVLSPGAAQNVDVRLPFVTVVEQAEDLPLAVANANVRNEEFRDGIRAHAREQWDWSTRFELAERQLRAWSGQPMEPAIRAS